MDLYQKCLVYLGILLASPLAGWAIGAILPWLIAVFQKPGQPKWLRALIMLGVCLVSSIALVLKQQEMGVIIPPDRFPILVIQTIVATFVMYKGLWEYLGVRRFESFTSDLGARVASAAGIVRGLEITFNMVKPTRSPAPCETEAPYSYPSDYHCPPPQPDTDDVDPDQAPV